MQSKEKTQLKITLGELAHLNAIETLKKCSTKNGFYASGGKDGYDSVWARDSAVGILGALFVPKNEFKSTIRATLDTLSKHQGEKGQIPNCVDLFSKRKKQVTFATIDSSLWFVIIVKASEKMYGKQFGKKYSGAVKKAMKWVDYQDAGEDGLPEQQPTSDWQDCFPHKYGHVLSTQALYYAALNLTGEKKKAEGIKARLNGKYGKDLCMFDNKLGYYLPWIWKNHDGARETEQWFDSLGNLLAITTGLAEKKHAEKILSFIESKNIAKPFPIRVIYPPLKKGSPEWKPYFENSLASEPHAYINGGIWPFVGAFYISSLVKQKKYSEAKKALDLLLNANKLGAKKEWEFNEWIHPITKKASGSSHHAWSAGGYLFAKKCVEKKKVVLF
jgi:glycogen debranching enzyme